MNLKRLKLQNTASCAASSIGGLFWLDFALTPNRIQHSERFSQCTSNTRTRKIKFNSVISQVLMGALYSLGPTWKRFAAVNIGNSSRNTFQPGSYLGPTMLRIIPFLHKWSAPIRIFAKTEVSDGGELNNSWSEVPFKSAHLWFYTVFHPGLEGIGFIC